MTSANELPYFEGDFWPNVLEESIKELEQEEEERKKEENTATCETPEVRTRPLLTGSRADHGPTFTQRCREPLRFCVGF